jgi:hypothetical protein
MGCEIALRGFLPGCIPRRGARLGGNVEEEEMMCGGIRAMRLAWLAGGCAMWLSGTPVLGGAPNDNCRQPVFLDCGESVTMSNADATVGPTDPDACGPEGPRRVDKTLWFYHEATGPAIVVSTCGSNGAEDTVVAVYRDRDGCDTFDPYLGCDFDACAPHAEACADVVARNGYYILVASAPGTQGGEFTLTLTCLDECALTGGACCFEGGARCEDEYESEEACRAAGGYFAGLGHHCDDDPSPCARTCGEIPVIWDNDIRANGFNARAVSPPMFPDNRVLEDFVVPDGGWVIDGMQVNVLEDDDWIDGGAVEVAVRDSDPNGGPVRGVGNELVRVVVPFTKRATGLQFFGRNNYDYCMELDAQRFFLPGASGGRIYWVGFRNPDATGTGSNYWATSSGLPDGIGTDRGWYSMDSGATFFREDASWFHAFELNGRPAADVAGYCCAMVSAECARDPEWVCDGDVDGNGAVNPVDSGLVQANFCSAGQCDDDDLCQYDLDCNGAINPVDAGLVQSLFGACDPPRDPCAQGKEALCLPALEEDCSAMNGEFGGYGTTCDGDPCGFARGACCTAQGACTDDVLARDCTERFEEGVRCADLDPPCTEGEGACCIDSEGLCEEITGRACAARDGRFLGYGTTCDADPCDLATGACCLDDECVATNRRIECDGLGGRWFEGEDCGAGYGCAVRCAWDNNRVSNGRNARGVSPPNFPQNRVVDDFVVPAGGCTILSFLANGIEDAEWLPGDTMEVTVRLGSGGAPVGGPDGIVQEVGVTDFTRTDTGDLYFGRASYLYEARGLEIPLDEGTYWIGFRHPNAGGRGTSYWLTSDGGPDGSGSSTGYLSSNSGINFAPEGAGWHHAFVVNP